MNSTGDAGNASDTQTAIMEATYAALCKHGYAGLTMQAIADEFDKTKAVLHYHYDTKEELLIAFLDYLLDRFLDAIDTDAIDDSEERLVALVDARLLGEHEGRTGTDHWEYHTALLEVRAQAPHSDAFREQLTTNYRFIEDTTAAIIEEGIEAGVFREVDPRRTAALLLATINGARLHQVTLDADVAGDVRDAIVEDVLRWLRTPGAE